MFFHSTTLAGASSSTAMICKRLLVTLLTLLNLTLGDAKGGGGGGGGGGGFSGGSGTYHGGSSGGGDSTNSDGRDTLMILGIIAGVAAAIGIVVCSFCWIRVKRKSEVKKVIVEEEYNSEIAKYCPKETVPSNQDFKPPPSGTWTGTYKESGVSKPSTYELAFEEAGQITGQTRDKDGKATIRGRYYDMNGTMKVVWLEDYGRLMALCRGTVSVDGSAISGSYKASTGVMDTFTCKWATVDKLGHELLQMKV